MVKNRIMGWYFEIFSVDFWSIHVHNYISLIVVPAGSAIKEKLRMDDSVERGG